MHRHPIQIIITSHASPVFVRSWQILSPSQELRSTLETWFGLRFLFSPKSTAQYTYHLTLSSFLFLFLSSLEEVKHRDQPTRYQPADSTVITDSPVSHTMYIPHRNNNSRNLNPTIFPPWLGYRRRFENVAIRRGSSTIRSWRNSLDSLHETSYVD
ncbi:hypothetical protein BDV27DRAFT_136754 [Aspergillus caelatus]|uniref:Uncharacterized protein n=2 Tax=Aspergillus subgen. Circumdati TaxID=2720871 RepID=A0A5N6ZQ17_9EURO|nr:uncharacterized protein BDV27DRAFT_136754 [Aspergillus caelatus]KAE8359056.1 hypothetical protein BDV27DRAFT_136754 [Aspergillus caelatus]KAE8411305.1 hypothetical protein BDV36DRAFT_89143 [Aspergillus pseudocaelatus]